METVRRGGETLGTRKLHRCEGGGKRVFLHRALIRSEFPQDMADHFSRLAAADAHLQPGEGVRVQVLDDGFDAVVSSRGTFLPESEGAERQGDIVINHQDVLRRPFVEGEDLLERPAAQVHEGLRLEEQRPVTRDLRQVALPLGDALECSPGLRRQPVQHHEAYIVAGILILAAGIPEPHDQLEHVRTMDDHIRGVQPEDMTVED